MRTLLVLFACLLGGAALVGCGGASCDSPRCSGDPKPNDSTIKACKDIQATKCSDPFNAWAGCIDDATKCDPATKTTDPATKLAAFSACKAKYDAMTSCCMTYSVACPTSR